jgi:chromate transporter
VGWWLFGRGGAALPTNVPSLAEDGLHVPLRRRTGLLLLLVFAALLVLLPLAVSLWPDMLLALFDAFYRVGALVFGGGHVMLPLLQAVVVPPGWVSADAFLAGYGATQAVPGPLFTFAAFLGAAMAPWPGGWIGALVCLAAIFLPSFLLVAGALPFWEPLRRNTHAQAALAGVNAAVVGLLLAALYDPVWTSAILGAADFGLALLAFVALVFWRAPPWAVVLASGVAGAMLAHGV